MAFYRDPSTGETVPCTTCGAPLHWHEEANCLWCRKCRPSGPLKLETLKGDPPRTSAKRARKKATFWPLVGLLFLVGFLFWPLWILAIIVALIEVAESPRR